MVGRWVLPTITTGPTLVFPSLLNLYLHIWKQISCVLHDLSLTYFLSIFSYVLWYSIVLYMQRRFRNFLVGGMLITPPSGFISVSLLHNRF